MGQIQSRCDFGCLHPLNLFAVKREEESESLYYVCLLIDFSKEKNLFLISKTEITFNDFLDIGNIQEES